MINPSTINPSTLPFVPLDDRRSLPSEPCIYFAIDGHGTVQYIGRTANLKQRWTSHDKRKKLSSMEGVKIAYLFVDTVLQSSVEAALIEWFNPPLNNVPGWPKGRLRPELSKGPTIRPSPVTQSVYERFVKYAIRSGISIRDAMEAAMLAYMDGGEVLSMDDEIEEFAALGRLDDDGN